MVPLSTAPFRTVISMPPSCAICLSFSDGAIPRDRYCFRDCKNCCFCSTMVLCRDIVMMSGKPKRGVNRWGPGVAVVLGLLTGIRVST